MHQVVDTGEEQPLAAAQPPDERVLQGARETVARCKPVLIVEVVNNDNVNSGLIDSIKKMGYTGRAMLTKNMVFCAR